MLPRNSFFASLGFLATAALLIGCGDDAAAPVDAGGGDAGPMMMDDAGGGGMDAGPDLMDLPTCDAPTTVTGMVGDTVVTGDTSLGVSGPRDLGPNCNNQDALRWAPQEVIEYTVPGTGPMGIRFSTVNTGTDGTFDTVVQVRTDCSTIPDDIVPTCFDSAMGTDVRAAGATNAMGGDTLFFIVTGWSESDRVMGAIDRGRYTLVITAAPNDLPEVTAGEVRAIGDRGEIEVTGEDDDMDVQAFRVTFIDDMGTPIDLDFDGDGTLDGNNFARRWQEDLTGMSPFTTINEYAGLGPAITGVMPSPTMATIELIDGYWALGPPFMVGIRELNEVGLGATCDMMNICARPLTCNAMMACEAPPAIVAACAAATPITIATPTTTTTSATVMGTLDMGTGPFRAPCAFMGANPDAGPEVLYTVDVPMGNFDLLVRTDLPGTGMTDTVVWTRATCEDPLTAGGCNDDIDTSGGVYQSVFEVQDVTAGTHTIFVEQWNGGMMSGQPFAMEVSLRPVLASGATCDNMGVMNRCAGGACAGGTCP